jgi:hypothetical protein
MLGAAQSRDIAVSRTAWEFDVVVDADRHDRPADGRGASRRPIPVSWGAPR